ncbi:MAG: hypothetical protein C4533_07405 [Candidatus Omnitrophota bacterium]|jgi:vacuolar-type H+-ATPase subunit E/Vma4|nr:MAG: hypothetical protein C4533_07405 [Candidatus Omnitrophota bacterium]
MPEDIKGLIQKIQEEGIKAAQDKARKIEEEAALKASGIVAEARKEAERLIKQAKDNIAREEESSKAMLSQAGRDFIITLKREVNNILDRIIDLQVKEALTPQELGNMMNSIIKGCNKSSKEDIIISVSKADIEKLSDTFLAKLKNEAKREIVLKQSQEISAGFIISFDSGKSHFDFTDKALAEFIGSQIKPKLKEILEPIASKKG